MKHGTAHIAYALAALWLGTACSSSTPGGSHGQTHWLRDCASDAECGELSCECGVCIAPCSGDASCDLSGRSTTCQSATSGAVAALCGGGAAPAMCLEPCGDGCATGQRCVSGACIPTESSGMTGGGSGGASAGQGGDAGRGGSSASGRGGDGGGATGAGTGGGGGGVGGRGGSSAGTGGAGTGSAGEGGASGAGNDAGMACVALEQRCEVADDQCCAGTRCMQTACTNSIPPSCFGQCRADGGGKLDAGNLGGDIACGPGGLRCDSKTEACVSHQAFMTRYSCEPLPASCNGKPSCECLVDSACEPGFKTCNDDQPNELACICIAC